MNVLQQLRRLIEPLAVRVRLMVARAVVLQVDDSQGLQVLQLGVLKGEVRDRVERFGTYGLTSHPHDGAESVVVFPSGNREHGLAVSVDDRRYRLKGLEQGEVALYDDQGTVVHIQRGGVVRIAAASRVSIESPVVELAGDARLEVGGGGEYSLADLRSTFNSHTHDGSPPPDQHV